MDSTEGRNLLGSEHIETFVNFLVLTVLNILFFQVLVTVPLTLLQKNLVHFTPPLPERKMKAIHSLGAGIIEKVFHRPIGSFLTGN